MKKAIITGSSGLVGSALVKHFILKDWEVIGIDNNQRMNFFGKDADTSSVIKELYSSYKAYRHVNIDIRNFGKIKDLFREHRPNLVVHAAGQPSHEYSQFFPLVDFEINAYSTHHLLETVRLYSPNSTFVYMSSNKVYGTNPNELELTELNTRWEFKENKFKDGISETMSIDNTIHSVFGVSKLAADLLVQEYGKYYKLNTCSLRAGCITGIRHAAVEEHGFLAYLVKSILKKKQYKIIGYKGKQVRDNIDAIDIANFIYEFYLNPRAGEVYNLGGGRENSCSIIEAINIIRTKTNKSENIIIEYEETPRLGDHICYISNLLKSKTHYPNWKITQNLDTIITSLIDQHKKY